MSFEPSWSDEKTELLRSLWTEGLSASDIGKKVGKTRNAVLGKAHRLGLASRIDIERPQRPSTPRVYVPKVKMEEPEPILEPPLVLDDGSNVTVLTINDRHCRWPIGHPNEDTFHFCGLAPKADRPYCEAHARKAYQPQQSHRRKADNIRRD